VNAGDWIIAAALGALLLIATRPRIEPATVAGSILNPDAAQPAPSNPAPATPATVWIDAGSGTLAGQV
jgi:hypothetical protein